MTPDEANLLRYLETREYASTHEVNRHFRWDLPAAEIRLGSLLSHSQVEVDARRYYRITAKGKEDLSVHDDHWTVKPFDGSRRYV